MLEFEYSEMFLGYEQQLYFQCKFPQKSRLLIARTSTNLLADTIVVEKDIQ